MGERRRFRFVEWTLSVTCGVRHVGVCLDCGERCQGAGSPDDAQLWCLRHAGVSGHTAYELSVSQEFGACPAVAQGVYPERDRSDPATM
ncbi:DUF7848 domain-containing protein [Streptomyces sp. WG-D5]